MQRQLYGWKPDETKPTPDLAEDLPEVSNGGKTVTVKIKPNIKYSAPLQNRTVKSADVKYALERCFLPQVGNGYANVYYGGIEGVKAYTDKKADEISGIETPDDLTLVINSTEPSGILADGSALGMPCTVPVPKDYAQKYDEGKQSTYGQHQVFTGPYMIENDGKGNVTGYEPSKRLVLVRNPSWEKSTDFKPAYFDRIVETCCSDATVAARKTLSGQGYLSGDYAAPPIAVLKQALSSRKDQISVEPSGGNRYISLNTTVKPLDNVNVRRAISAVIDRDALRQTRGGPTLGTTATHFLPPGIAGFEEAGGEEGPGFDFTSNPKADVALAKQYMQKAGYENGMYDGAAAADGRGQRVAGEGDGGGVPESGRQDRHQAAAASAAARHGELEVLPRAEVEHGDLPEPGLGPRLLRRAELHRPAVQRREHRAERQREHG